MSITMTCLRTQFIVGKHLLVMTIVKILLLVMTINKTLLHSRITTINHSIFVNTMVIQQLLHIELVNEQSFITFRI
jgi:hypothetical protein